ncbi:hypothetical protein HYR99_35725 [Candidatus Poribacteria bacterium]|nr:hypothetical protein [Candidatus Poribacteria bacterium]
MTEREFYHYINQEACEQIEQRGFTYQPHTTSIFWRQVEKHYQVFYLNWDASSQQQFYCDIGVSLPFLDVFYGENWMQFLPLAISVRLAELRYGYDQWWEFQDLASLAVSVDDFLKTLDAYGLKWLGQLETLQAVKKAFYQRYLDVPIPHPYRIFDYARILHELGEWETAKLYYAKAWERLEPPQDFTRGGLGRARMKGARKVKRPPSEETMLSLIRRALQQPAWGRQE